MQSNQSSPNTDIDRIKGYTIPKLFTGKEWYIGFMAFDPVSGRMKRKRIKLNHIEKISDRRKYASELIRKLLIQLEKGWNPWIESGSAKAYKTFEEACEHYRKYIFKLYNDGVLRKDTYRSYISQLRNISEWNKERKVAITYIYQFDQNFVNEFLDDIYVSRGISGRTRNNYLTFIRTFGTFLLEKQYVKAKPTDGISSISKRKLKKQRTTIDENDITKLYEYLIKNNKHFLLASYLLHYCFVRRKEMSYLRISDISIKNQTLFISEEISKNRENAIVTIPEKVIHLMLDLKIFEYPNDYYLFSENFKPGKARKTEKQFTDYWSFHIRKDLKFPMHYQFYSLKDTGITDMLRIYDVITVRDQARHSDIKITNEYTPHDLTIANDRIKRHKGML